MATYSGTNQAPSAQGAPINQMSNAGINASNAPTGMSQYDQNPGYLDTNQGTSTYEAIQQAPQWLQQMNKRQILGSQQAGSYDPSLQMRDIYQQWQPRLHQAIGQYGAEAVANPYFSQNMTQFQGQFDDPGFDPFSQGLQDYQLQKRPKYGWSGGQQQTMQRQGFEKFQDVYGITRNPWTGEVMSNQGMVARRENLLDPRMVGENRFNNASGGHPFQMVAALQRPRATAEWNKYAPYLDDQTYEQYMLKNMW